MAELDHVPFPDDQQILAAEIGSYSALADEKGVYLKRICLPLTLG